MFRSLTSAGAGMVAQQQNLDVIANNLANVNTTGFKQQAAEFQDLMYATYRASGAANAGSVSAPEPVQVGTGSRLAATANSFRQGPLQATGNVLDLAIMGDGFFSLERPDGTTAYTRDGTFKMDANGLLVTNDGMSVSPNITIPTGATAITISNTGALSAILPGSNQPTTLGTLRLTMFANPAGLTRVGQNLYLPGGASGDPQEVEPGQSGSGLIQSGFTEGSNVQIVDEMVRMITAQRAYEINSKAIQTADDMLGVLVTLKR
ncbi:MAG: flagellar basal-body rod protein FlgG [Chthonomonas sp.]|nr:flagellar basal-body rod protein FlgG [Chthonomonas sp.]